MQSRLNALSIASLAFIAAKILKAMYPHLSFSVKEDTLQMYNYGPFPSYTVYSSDPEENWVTFYRIDEPNGNFNNMWTTCEYYTFISTVWEPEYHVFTREEEFEKLFLQAIGYSI